MEQFRAPKKKYIKHFGYLFIENFQSFDRFLILDRSPSFLFFFTFNIFDLYIYIFFFLTMSIMVNTSTRKDIIHIDIRKKSESFAGKRRSRQDSSVLEAFRTIQEAPSKHERVKVLDAEGAIFFHKIWSGITRHTAQPTSPKGDFDFEGVYESVPDILPPLDGIELPYVRDVGVKESIRILGSYFQCDNYDVNLCHFWFLDVVVDALWRAQDVYNFEMEQQRAVLEWIICIFNFIRGQVSFFRNIYHVSFQTLKSFSSCKLLHSTLSLSRPFLNLAVGSLSTVPLKRNHLLQYDKL